LAKQAIINGIKLIFIHEKFAFTSNADLPMLKTLLIKTEHESKVIGIRIRTARKHLKDQGLHPGGAVPFGYELKMSEMGNRPIPNEYEQIVISFIKICKSNKIQSTELNSCMKRLVSIDMLNNYDNIDCYDNNGDRVNWIDKMDDLSIAALLNDYGITKRGKSWTSSSIKTAMNGEKYVAYKPVRKNIFNFQSLTSSLNDIEDINNPKKKSKKTHQIEVKSPEVESSEVKSSEVESPEVESPEVESPEVESSESNMNDMKLFSEFLEFKKMLEIKKMLESKK
jgi:hypothetical protein